MFGVGDDIRNNEESEDGVNELARDMGRVELNQAYSSTPGNFLNSPILSSAESYNLTVEAYTISEEDEAEEVEDDAWRPVAGFSGEDNSFLIHGDLFKKGILAIRPYSLEDEPLLTVSNNSFAISSSNSAVKRNFAYCTRGEFLYGRTPITLSLVETLPTVKGSLEKYKVYIEQQGGQLLYAVMLDRKRVTGILNDINIATVASDEFLDQHKYAILNNIYKNGHIKNGHLMKIESLLDELKAFLEYQPNAIDINNILVNSNRTEEIFFPIILKESLGTSSKELGFYVYPWMFDNIKDFRFSGFTRFVTAGCMFGTSIKAFDHDDWSCNFIKHKLPFSPEQKICGILIDIVSCYEQALFNELDKLLLVVDTLSKRDCKKQIYYHLPFYDYILFGVELFNKNRIELAALDKFFKAIINKREEHVNNIKDICTRHDIDYIIGSPFENLFEYNNFASIKNKNYKKQDKDFSLARYILSSFDILVPSESSQEAVEYPRYKDDQLINIILNKLSNNDFNLEHKEVWRDFIAATMQEPEQNMVKNIDDLFKIANALMVAVACKGQQDYTVCALHTLSEKPISVSYGGLRNLFKKVHKDKTYGASFNMTVMEPILGYSPSCNGVLFYFPNNNQDIFGDLINNRKILSDMHRNIANIARGRDSTALEEVLPYLNPSI